MVKTISLFLHPEKNVFDWSDVILKCYPDLARKIKSSQTEKSEKKIIYDFFSDLRKKRKNKIDKTLKNLKSSWGKIEKDIFGALSDITETNLSRNSSISAFLSFNPICPRHIETKEFLIYIFFNKKEMLATMIHEIFHFYFFKKFSEIFPKVDKKKYDAPYLEWCLSEIIVEAVLNDKKVQKVFKYNFKTYKEFQKARIEGELLLLKIDSLYKKRINFEDFTGKTYRFLKDNEKIIRARS